MKITGKNLNHKVVSLLINNQISALKMPILWHRGSKWKLELQGDELMEISPTQEVRPSGIKLPAKSGDLFWVREAWRLFNNSDECGCSEYPCGCPATGTPLYRSCHDDGESKWNPSIHMPRKLSRLTLRVTSISIEQLTTPDQVDEMDSIFKGYKKKISELKSDCNHEFEYDWVWKIEVELTHKNIDTLTECS